jgi:hypothetical protein
MRGVWETRMILVSKHEDLVAACHARTGMGPFRYRISLQLSAMRTNSVDSGINM